jgi:hypothetical protein
MPNFTDLTGLASIATGMTAACMLVPAIARPSTTLRTGLSGLRLAVVLALVFVLALIPFGGLPFAAYLRGEIGDLSITTLVLLWAALSRPWGCCIAASPRHRSALLVAIALAALLLYPMALGIGTYDPYRLGFGDPLVVAALLLLALAAWYGNYTTIALCLSLSVLAWTLGWYESDNLWDYLLDPLVAIYALSALAKRGVNSLWRAFFLRA